MRCAHLFGLATILRLAFTAPFSISNTTNTTESPGSLQGEYYLMTSVIGDGNRDKNDLFVSGYHTGKFDSRKCFSTNKIDQVAGAGLNDVVLGNIDIASKGFINDTHQQFDYNTSFPWAFQMGGDTNYAGRLNSTDHKTMIADWAFALKLGSWLRLTQGWGLKASTSIPACSGT